MLLISSAALYHDGWKDKTQPVPQLLARIFSFEYCSTIQHEDDGSEWGYSKPALAAIAEWNDGHGEVSLFPSLAITFRCKGTAQHKNKISTIIAKLRISRTMRATSTSVVVAMMAWPRRRQAREMCAPSIVCCRSSSGPCSGNFQQCFGLVLERGSWTRVGWKRGTRGRGGLPTNRLPGARDSTHSRLTYPAGLHHDTRTTDCLFYDEIKYKRVCATVCRKKKRVFLYSFHYVYRNGDSALRCRAGGNSPFRLTDTPHDGRFR